MSQHIGDVPDHIEQPESSAATDHADIARRIEEADDFKPEQLREASEVPLPEVRGFDRSGLMTDQEVKGYLAEALPPEHVSPESLTSIEYVDMYVPYQEGDVKGNILGSTQPNLFTESSKIEVYRQVPDGNLNRSEMEHTIAHEVGHSVYNDMGWVARTPRQLAWEELSANSTPNEYVSDYARTDVHEDFAESYATYVHDPEHLRDVSQDKYNFMRDQVFHGREYQWSRS